MGFLEKIFRSKRKQTELQEFIGRFSDHVIKITSTDMQRTRGLGVEVFLSLMILRLAGQYADSFEKFPKIGNSDVPFDYDIVVFEISAFLHHYICRDTNEENYDAEDDEEPEDSFEKKLWQSSHLSLGFMKCSPKLLASGSVFQNRILSYHLNRLNKKNIFEILNEHILNSLVRGKPLPKANPTLNGFDMLIWLSTETPIFFSAYLPAIDEIADNLKNHGAELFGAA